MWPTGKVIIQDAYTDVADLSLSHTEFGNKCQGVNGCHDLNESTSPTQIKQDAGNTYFY